MSKVIIIRGEGNSGKSTTAGYLYQDLIKLNNVVAHQFNGKTVLKDSLTRNSRTNAVNDFVAILDINGKIVVIISAGDVWADLLEIINGLPPFDVLVCCARTGRSITYKELNAKYGSQIVHVENIVKQANDAKAHKQAYINNIISKI